MRDQPFGDHLATTLIPAGPLLGQAMNWIDWAFKSSPLN
jgi:hypothetical protein